MNKSNAIKKYKEEDYFSDDDDQICEQNDENEEGDDVYEEEEDDDEMDAETRRIIWEATTRRSANYDFADISKEYNEKKSKKKSSSNSNQKQKKNASLSLEQFNKLMEEKIKENKPKKFVSKRAEEKKKMNGVEEQVYKRHFNPKLPPYNFVNKTREAIVPVDLNNKNDFPSLLDNNC
jgi:hypothetical protein